MREIGMVIREWTEFDHGATLAQAASCFHGPEADGTAPTLERGEDILASKKFDRMRLAATTLDDRMRRYSVIKILSSSILAATSLGRRAAPCAFDPAS